MRAMTGPFLLAGLMTLRAAVALAGAAAGNVTFDGILKVKGMPFSGARSVMVVHDGSQVMMEQGLERFNLTLQLNSEYLHEFTREGCVTKQLLVDRLPVRGPKLERAPSAGRSLRSALSTAPSPGPVHRKDARPSNAIPEHAALQVNGSSREDGFVKEKQHMSKIVRIVEQGRLTEYHRVENRFGAVYYFRNGEACRRNT